MRSLNAKAELTELEIQRTETTVGEIKGSNKSIALEWKTFPGSWPNEAGGGDEFLTQLNYVFGQPDQVC